MRGAVRTFEPQMAEAPRQARLAGWQAAIGSVLGGGA
jgi:hypothetical protein